MDSIASLWQLEGERSWCG